MPDSDRSGRAEKWQNGAAHLVTLRLILVTHKARSLTVRRGNLLRLQIFRNSASDLPICAHKIEVQPVPRSSIAINAPSSSERLEMFGRLLGAAWPVWRRKGRPHAGDQLGKKQGGRPARPRKPMSRVEDLRVQIADVLNRFGPQSPHALEILVRRSHRPVYNALKGLIQSGVVAASGSTRGRRYAVLPGWREALIATSIKRGS